MEKPGCEPANCPQEAAPRCQGRGNIKLHIASQQLAGAFAGGIGGPARRAGLVHQGLQARSQFVQDGLRVFAADNHAVEQVNIEDIEFAAARTEANRQQSDNRIFRGCLRLHGFELLGDAGR